MPEAPEVYNFLQEGKFIKGKNIKEIIWRNKTKKAPKMLKELSKSFPIKITDIKRKGKTIYTQTSNGYTIVFSFGMSGYFERTRDDIHEDDKQTKVVVVLTNGDKLLYRNIRNFGNVYIEKNESIEDSPKWKKLGPDFLDEMTKTNFDKQLKNYNESKTLREKQLLQMLMDQERFFSGIGNYLKAEILYQANLCPTSKVKDLGRSEINQLYRAMKKVGDRGYVTKVYRRDGTLKGETVLGKKTKDGRTTWYVKKQCSKK